MNKFIFILGSVVLFSVLAVFVFAAEVMPNINPNIPGGAATSDENPDPAGVIGSIYKFALMGSGVLAFGAIVYGGILWASSGGNESKIKDAREWITQALIGLLLLLGAGLILSTISPKFSLTGTGLNVPGITPLSTSTLEESQTPTGGSNNPSGGNAYGCDLAPPNFCVQQCGGNPSARCNSMSGQCECFY